MKTKFLIITTLFVFSATTIFATECYCKKGNTEYYWSSGGKCSQATGCATKYVSGKQMDDVDASEAIEACG
jgi:hypothetical protein